MTATKQVLQKYITKLEHENDQLRGHLAALLRFEQQACLGRELAKLIDSQGCDFDTTVQNSWGESVRKARELLALEKTS